MTIANNQYAPRQADRILATSEIRYSICTLVNKPNEYREMVDSFRSKGFLEPDVEYLYLDNSAGNKFNAYAGYNIFLRVARGRYVILCHQDVVLLEDGRSRLDQLIAELGELDPNWGLLGNAGGECPGRLAIRISDPRGENTHQGQLPTRVYSLDENFIVVRSSTNLGLSRDLSAYHFYGTDLSIIGDILGYSIYVVDFHLRHKGAGNCDADFYAALEQLIRKYRRAFRQRYVATTCSTLFLSGSRAMKYLLNRGDFIELATVIGKRFPALFRHRSSM